ncbi:MAG: hypothetical protein R3B45_00730 [Bdellovibrionota bacterium]
MKESKDVLKNAALERKDEKAKTVTITKKDQSQKTLKAAPKPTQQNYAGKITNLPRNNITLWTQKNLLNTNLALEMQVSPPELEGGQKLASWIPYIKTINPTNKKNSRLFKGQNAFQKQTISIPTSQVLTLAAKNNKNGIINWNFQIKGGAIASYDPSSNPREYIENTVYNYKLISLLNIEDYPLEIGLNTLNNTINNSIWFTQKLKIPANQAKYYINIYDKSSIVSIIPYLKNGMFSLRSINIPQNYGIYAAKNLKIIASLKGLIDKNSAKIIKKMLNADVIFEGDPNAILNASGKSVEDLKSWIDSPTNTNNKIYIMNGGALVQVSKNFIKNRSQVLRFIGRNASYIFSKKVNILDTKN